jgi:hypothetical protein
MARTSTPRVAASSDGIEFEARFGSAAMQAFIGASRKSSLAIRGQVGEMSSPRPVPVEATKLR